MYEMCLVEENKSLAGPDVRALLQINTRQIIEKHIPLDDGSLYVSTRARERELIAIAYSHIESIAQKGTAKSEFQYEKHVTNTEFNSKAH